MLQMLKGVNNIRIPFLKKILLPMNCTKILVFGIILSVFLLISVNSFSQNKRIRDYGIEIGILKTGTNNAITDVDGVKIGHTTTKYSDGVQHQI